MKYLARVNPHYLAAMTFFAAKEDVRYYLNGITIEPHPEQGVILMATNGHVLAAVHDPEGWCERKIILANPSKAMFGALKTKRYERIYKAEVCWIAEKFSVITWAGGDQKFAEPEPFGVEAILTTKSELIETDRPVDWRKVIGKPNNEVPQKTPWISANYLKLFADAYKVISEADGYSAMRLEYTGENTVAIVRFSHFELFDRFVGAVMPMRGDGEGGDLVPAFARPPKESV